MELSTALGSLRPNVPSRDSYRTENSSAAPPPFFFSLLWRKHWKRKDVLQGDERNNLFQQVARPFQTCLLRSTHGKWWDNWLSFFIGGTSTEEFSCLLLSHTAYQIPTKLLSNSGNDQTQNPKIITRMTSSPEPPLYLGDMAELFAVSWHPPTLSVGPLWQSCSPKWRGAEGPTNIIKPWL